MEVTRQENIRVKKKMDIKYWGEWKRFRVFDMIFKAFWRYRPNEHDYYVFIQHSLSSMLPILRDKVQFTPIFSFAHISSSIDPYSLSQLLTLQSGNPYLLSSETPHIYPHFSTKFCILTISTPFYFYDQSTVTQGCWFSWLK